MYSIWLYLKESTNCSCKLMDIHQFSVGKLDWNKDKKEKNNNGRDFILIKRERLSKSTSLKRSYPHEGYYELTTGDPSRNVIERIFQRASTVKQAGSIEKVLRVRNSVETIKRFEEYRETVKKRACCNSLIHHPRSIVDGNELLRFYCTTMTCCSKEQNMVSELCHNLKCNVCRMIQTGFDNEETRKMGIRFSADIDMTPNSKVAFGENGDCEKRAVVICRVIAGSDKGFDSVNNGGFSSKLEPLFVMNPKAILPCFVIVCS